MQNQRNLANTLYERICGDIGLICYRHIHGRKLIISAFVRYIKKSLIHLTSENVEITAKIEKVEPGNWKREKLKLEYKSTEYGSSIFGLGIEINRLLGFSEKNALSQGISTPGYKKREAVHLSR